jgi:hypothetical protein
MAHQHRVYDTDARFTIDAHSREIKNAASKKITVVQYDHKSERFTFELPRYIEGHDMSECNKVEVHYINIDSTTKAKVTGLYEVDDLQVNPENEEKVICSWLIDGNATQYAGQLSFLVRYCCLTDTVVDYAWNTAIFSDVYVTTGLNASETIVVEYIDILERWKESLFNAGYINADQMQKDIANLAINLATEKGRIDLLSNYVTPEMFGAVGDGETDDSVAFQQAVDTGRIVKLGAKTYALYDTVNLSIGCQITGNKNSIVHAYAPTVFHTSEKNTISGFTIRVKSADVLNVFEADDNSGGANIAGDGALLFTTIENMTVYRDVSVATPLYTVFHFHVNKNNFYDIKVHACTCACNGTNGYAARVYSNGSGWLSTCSFIDCNTSGFNWHYFFAENDQTILSNSEGMHNLTNCIGQCTPETHGFAFLPNIRSARITNCTTWDWGSDTAGSRTCKGKPYVIGPNQERVQLDSICNDISVEGIATYDGKDFGDIAFDVTKAINAGAQYSTHLIPKYTGIPMVPCVKLLTINSGAGKRVRFYVCDHRGITYVAIYPYEKKAVLSRPLYDIAFALSADSKTVYMYKNGGNIPANFGILTLPVSNLMISFGGGNSKNTELTPDVWKEPENRWMDALPSDAVKIPNRVEPNAYVSDEDGNFYKISIVTASDGTKSIGFERAYDSARETDY